jgi:hypothetical protein
MLVVSRLFAQSFAVGVGLLGTGSSTNAIGRARRMFHAERHYMISTRMNRFGNTDFLNGRSAVSQMSVARS